MILRVNQLIIFMFLMGMASAASAETMSKLYVSPQLVDFGERLTRFMQLYLGKTPRLMLSSDYARHSGYISSSMEITILPRTQRPGASNKTRIRLGELNTAVFQSRLHKSQHAKQQPEQKPKKTRSPMRLGSSSDLILASHLKDVWLELPPSISDTTLHELQSMLKRQDVIRSLAAMGVEP